jgi:predicted peptidase
MRHPMLRTVLFVLAVLAARTATAAPATETGFIDAIAHAGDMAMPYVVYVPRNYTPDQKWPVILFLHGAGERGDDGLKQTAVGIGGAIRLHPERFPCIVVMPQCPPNRAWGQGNRGGNNPAADTVTLALAALDAAVDKYHGDPDRLYLTGLSLGGYGTWEIGTRRPGKFAALMPICGGGRPAEAAVLKDLPIWAFHGDADMTVPIQRSRDMVEAIKAAGGTHVRLTEYPGVGHNSWDKAYNDPEAIAWLLSQKRGSAANP